MATSLDAQIEVLLAATTLRHLQRGQQEGVCDPNSKLYLDRVQQRLSELKNNYSNELHGTPELWLLERLMESYTSLDQVFAMPFEDLEWSARAIYAIYHNLGVRYVGELVSYREEDLMKLRNFGRKTLKEVKEELGGLTPPLSLGMKIFYIHPSEAEKYRNIFDTPITELGFTPSLQEKLKERNICYVGELVQQPEHPRLNLLSKQWEEQRDLQHNLRNLHPRLRLGLTLEYTRPEKGEK